MTESGFLATIFVAVKIQAFFVGGLVTMTKRARTARFRHFFRYFRRQVFRK